MEKAIFQGLDDARRRIGLVLDPYNFQRTSQGIDNLAPADRYFDAMILARREPSLSGRGNDLRAEPIGVVEHREE